MSVGDYFYEVRLVKPLLKWAGGKRHIAPLVQSHFPESWNSGRYFEPFLGGAAIFLHVNPQRAILADVNAHLVKFYTDVQVDPLLLVSQIREIGRQFDEFDDETPEGMQEKQLYFYDLRTQFNSSLTSPEHSALMYALNKLCFNGLYRENSKGAFNVPFGKRKIFPGFTDEEFLEVSRLLSGVEIYNCDFEAAVSSAVAGDFVYFDPPYVPIDATAHFTSYSSSGFGIEDQQRLAGLMFELAERGVKALMSNSATELTKEIYAGLASETISAPRMVSAKGSSRKPVDELLIMNF